MWAQRLSQRMRKPDAPLYYLATMIPTDSEDEARIIRHQQDREGWGFETVEVGRNILDVVNKCNRQGVFLLDSLTSLLANEMFMPDGHVEIDAYKRITGDLMQILNLIDDVVIVSDFIYSDAFLYDGLTESYRRGLAYIDRQMAGICDVVLEACGGVVIFHKGLLCSPRE